MISTQLKSRFCKDSNIPITLFQEPYFMDRIKLFDKQFNTIEKWNTFEQEIKQFNNEQDYFTYYNEVKDNFIKSIQERPEYNDFINCDISKFAVDNHGINNKSVFKETNLGKRLISIDLSKANFSAMKFYNKNLVDNANTYEELIGKFTNLQHIINSKYIRQVVFGNCNPRRQVTIEKYMMSFVLDILLKYMDKKYILTYMDDEIVFEYFDCSNLHLLYNDLMILQNEKQFKIKIEDYILTKIPNTDVYVKHTIDGKIDFKCANHLIYPFILRALNKQQITENDKVFYHEGYLSKFIETPEITFFNI